ncbi:MAG: M67 family metallopeptidase [Chloroflexota bacterium]
MILEPALAEEMIAHARAELPNEACGIVAGKDCVPAHFYPTTNIEHSPTRFMVDGAEVLRVQREMRAHGWEMLAIFHSHTHTAAYPSSTDTSFAANWPDVYYLIASLQNEPPVLRAFLIEEGSVKEEEVIYRQEA